MGVLDIQIASTSACSNAEQWADRRWWLQWFTISNRTMRM
jgi:hypothetical protein